MNKAAVTPAPVAKTLAEQKSDFTAEGSPPPGNVATATPVVAGAQDPATGAPRPVRATIQLRKRAVPRAPR